MTSQPLRVGIVGLQPGRSWAAKAHVPALHALSADFVIAGIANTTLASAVLAAAALDHGPRPFASVADLVASPDIDVVSVTVRVPYHLDVVKTAITAGKHVYCEWPLGNGLAEAEELARLAKEKGVLGVVGRSRRLIKYWLAVCSPVARLSRSTTEGACLGTARVCCGKSTARTATFASPAPSVTCSSCRSHSAVPAVTRRPFRR
jgi:hypothetical protein